MTALSKLRELVGTWPHFGHSLFLTDIHDLNECPKCQVGALLPELEQREQELVESLTWAFHYAQMDDEMTTGEQEDFSDNKAKAWERMRAALNLTGKP